MFRKAFNKAPVEVGKAEKGLHLLLVCRSGPFGDTSNLDGIHRDGVVRDDHSEVFDSGFLKLTFICLEIQLVLLQDLQDLSGDFSMFVNSFRKDEDVVQVDHDYAFCNELFKDVIHYCLEGSWAVCETEEHNKWFKQSVVCSESGLPFVTFLDVDVVEAPLNV